MNTRRSVILIAVFLGVSAPVLAHHGRLQEHLLSAQVVSAGRYTQADAGFIRAATHAVVDRSAVLLEETDRVPPGPDERFGFCFEVTGFLEDGEVDLQKLVTHPPVTIEGRTVDGYVETIELDVVNGSASGCIGHALDADRARIPGTWTIGLGAGETTLVERTFTIE